MSEAVVDLRDVFCVYRTNEGDAAALQGTNLELARGEVLCVLGPSGAGKSTLLRVIAGIQRPSAGIVRVLGRDVGRLRARDRARLRHAQLGFLSQHTDGTLAPDLPARHAVALPLAMRGTPRRALRRRVAELLDSAGLREHADRLPRELSGGERQRFALCAALAHSPALLLADEPTGELDEVSAQAVRTLIAKLARDDGTSVILASHDPATAAMADRTVRVRDGRVVEERREGETALVIDRHGWLQLPAELLAQADIGRRARVRPTPGGLIVSAAAIEPRVEPAVKEPAPGPPVRANAARVALQRLTRGYGHGSNGRRVLHELTLEFAPGQMTVVTGRSGAGKTTLLRLLAGLDQPDSGQLLIDEHPLAGYDREQLAALRRERIGYLPQEPSPVAFLSAEENVALVLRVRGWQPTAAAERAAVALTQVGLADRAKQRAHRLSAGEAQRLALARALASARGLLIVDEPTSRLDAVNAGAVAELLAAAAAHDAQTVICATHDPNVIREADKIVALEP